jgi:hypothetical protein
VPGGLQLDGGRGRGQGMDTIEQLINEIHEDNYSHLEFDENMGGEGCKCAIHTTLNTIVKYRDKGEEK